VLLLAVLVLAVPECADAHGTLVNDRMFQVRVAGPNGQTPAAWNDSFYTWNQNSHNFPDYATPGFSYATKVPDGTIAHAGINDGVQTALNFTALGTPSLAWEAKAATAGRTARFAGWRRRRMIRHSSKSISQGPASTLRASC
jgi:hypothetical protein